MQPDAEESAAFLRKAGIGQAGVGVIQGTGLGLFSKRLQPVLQRFGLFEALTHALLHSVGGRRERNGRSHHR